MPQDSAVRCYAAASLDAVRRWRDAGALPAGTRVTAVTRAVRDAVGPGDDEEYEYVATVAVVDLARADHAGGSLVVVAADAAASSLDADPDAGDAALRLRAPVPVHRWAALYAVGPGDDADPVLAWYAVSELDSIG